VGEFSRRRSKIENFLDKMEGKQMHRLSCSTRYVRSGGPALRGGTWDSLSMVDGAKTVLTHSTSCEVSSVRSTHETVVLEQPSSSL